MTKPSLTARICAGLLLLSPTLQAGNVFKADVPDNLNLGTSWVGGVAPGASDTAIWDHTVQLNTNSILGGALSWSGIQILDPAGPITIGADGNALTLGGGGIDLSLATNGLILSNLVALASGQTWAVANGQTLQAGGVISGTGPLTINGAGTTILGATNTYSGGVVINGGVVEPVGGAFGTSTGPVFLNDGTTLRFNLFPNGSIIANSNTVTGTVTLDLSNRGISAVLDGSFAGSGTLLITNMASGATLTLGGNGTGGKMNDFTGSVIVADTNSTGLASAGSLRFNNGGANNNVGNASATFNLGQGSVQFTEKNGGVTTYFGALIGGTNTALAKNENYVIGGANLDTTFAGTILSSSSLNKVGTGTFTLTGNNPYTGTTTVTAGTLQVGDGTTANAGMLGTGSVINNATLVFNRPDDFSVTNAISGTGATIKTNSNTLTYAGNDTASGTMQINQGTLALSSVGSISSSIFLAAGADFDVSQNPSFALSSTLSGSGTVSGALTASGATLSPGGTGTAGILTMSSGLTESGSVNNRFQLSAPGSTNDQINVTGDLTLSGINTVVAGAFGGGSLPLGTYTLITYTGNLTGGLGNLSLSVSGAFGTLTNPPGQIALIVTPPPRGPTNLFWLGDGVSNAWDINLSTNWVNGVSHFTFLNGDSVTFDNTGAANPTINITDTVLPAAVTLAGTANYTFTGIGDINGSTGLIKTNSGTVTILTTNSYTGPTIISGGTLAASDLENGTLSSGIGAANSAATNLVLNNGATLSYVGPGAATDRGATLNGSGGNLQVATSNANLTLNGTWTGTGALGVSGPGTLTVNAANTYSGGTTISNGVLALGSNTANNNGLGATNAPVTFYGGTLQLFGYSASTTPNYATCYNPLVVPAGQTGTLQMFPRGPGNSGAGSGLQSSLSGAGTLNLVVNYVRDNLDGNWSAFTGIINVTSKNGSGDEMRINNNFGYGNATIYLNNGVVMDTANSSATVNIGALSGDTNSVVGPGNGSGSNPTWSIGWNNTSSAYSGKIKDAGTTSLVKVGTGTLTFDGPVNVSIYTPDGFTFYTNAFGSSTNLSYSGPTVISNGVLRLVTPVTLTNVPTSGIPTPITLASPTAVLDGTVMGYYVNQFDNNGVLTNVALFTNGVFEVAPNQSLSGIGTILASNVLADAGSSVSPGLPLGTLNASQGVELAGAVNLNINALGTPNASELVAANITVDPTAVLTVTNLGPEAPATFQLFNHPVSGFASVNLPTLSGTNTWVNNLAVDGSITLVAPPYVNTNPTNITAVYNSGTGTLTLSWPADHTGWNLQVQTNTLATGIYTNWVDVTGANTTNQVVIPVSPTNGAVFFRMVYP